MPVISIISGIIIKMYFQQEDHNPPHVHAICNERSSIIYINGDKKSEGNLKHKDLVLAESFVANHKDELLEMWTSQNFHRIKGETKYVS